MQEADLFGVFDEAPRGKAHAEAKRAPTAPPREQPKPAKKARAEPGARGAPGCAPPSAPPSAPPAPAAAAGVAAASAARGAPSGEQAGAPALASSKAITHDVALPPGEHVVDPTIYTLEHPPCKPAREWPFELDPFQKAAKAAIERNESVLVAAHTSAGKTVCAEYAIATALRDGARVIYTSPIKALSNQKYRELHAEFGTVGLMTGDVTINPHAECLVMTTEILRSMLYRGSEVMREVSWVIFDEVHYMRDKERGVVWEETMIMVPDKVRFVFLSATIPNALEFASWVATLHQQPCHVVYTDYRPTPLKHYVIAEGGSGLHLVKEGEGAFKQANFDRALADLLASAEAKPAANKAKVKAAQGKPIQPGAKERGSAASDIARIVKIGHALSLFPMIVFALSKKDCESLALGMDKLDMTSDVEKEVIGEIFANAIEPLSEDDRSLPQVAKLLPILRRGVGIHHGGLLPLIKEVVELLFQEGLIKVLFATETFAMGLNMPARTVVFANARKFDGTEFRMVSAGEYIQMSGRAGRRGIDTTGIVIFRMERKASPESVKQMIVGSADNLTSAFKISYNMVLNCMRLETADVQLLMQKSFHTFQAEKALPALDAKREALEAELAAARLALPHAELCDELAALRAVRAGLADEMRRVANRPATVWPFVVPGRMASVRDDAHDWGWGVVVDAHGVRKGRGGGDDGGYTVDMLVPCCGAAMRGDNGHAAGTLRPRPLGPAAVASEAAEAAFIESAEMQVVRVRLDELDSVSSVRVLLPRDVRSADERHRVLKSALEVLRRFDGHAPLLDAKDDLGVTDPTYYKAQRKAEALDSRIASDRYAVLTAEHMAAHSAQAALASQLEETRATLKASRESVMGEELKCMRRVLRRLGHTNSDNVIELKGRIACEVSTADELLITELIFTGSLAELSAEQVVSLMSCLVALERNADSDDAKVATEEMRAPVETLQALAKRIGTVMLESKMPIDMEEYVKTFSVQLVDLVFEWCRGKRFVDLMLMTKQYEGSIIRMLHRLEELMRQLLSAAKTIGDAELEDKCARGGALLRRDIVFAASLYLDDVTTGAHGKRRGAASAQPDADTVAVPTAPGI
ncbi:hypothetical protein KFE25_007426 [Diacronema lutheri]|uniref:Uncharacterized protein n=3 Tax=Diacronema lutheri TaxID=2081491 RepID=A0A8J6CIK1_DIALT|nr:hypothetical protein KFE25_007426 [Diacronema lutheri]